MVFKIVAAEIGGIQKGIEVGIEFDDEPIGAAAQRVVISADARKVARGRGAADIDVAIRTERNAQSDIIAATTEVSRERGAAARSQLGDEDILAAFILDGAARKVDRRGSAGD